MWPFKMSAFVSRKHFPVEILYVKNKCYGVILDERRNDTATQCKHELSRRVYAA